MPANASELPLRFARFEILPAERVLRVDGMPTPVGARAFDLLLCLAQRRDRLVDKQELLDVVWPGVVVEEHNIATQIGTLRKLLGPQAIATVPGRGYRLTAVIDDRVVATPAVVVAAAAAAAAAQDAAQPTHPAHRLTPLLGRDEDLAALADMLRRYRLVNIVGAGGIGKSLLARHLLVQNGAQWANGTCWVELASISDAAMLPSRIADLVGVRVGGKDPAAALCAATAGLSLLLALDNAEHLIAGVAQLAAALLDASPGLRLLVTSQAPLKLAGEGIYRLGPLAVPPGPLPAAHAQNYASVALFVQRARDADAHFDFGDAQAAAAIGLCRQLDGLPLAIELAAARAPLLGVQRLNAMMQSRLQLLTCNRDAHAPARQQTLRAAIEWSHGLLDAMPRTVFRRLGVIVDSASLNFIQQIVADETGGLDAWAVLDALGALVDRSLVAVLPTDDAEPRYRLLETPRAFALEQLEATGERAMMQRRHATVLATLFDAAWPERWSGHIGIGQWDAAILRDANNAREAITWALAADEPAIAVSVAATLHMALPRQSLAERTRLSDLCESLVDKLDAPALHRRALILAVRPMYHPSQTKSLEFARRSLALAREQDAGAVDRWALYDALCTWTLTTALTAPPPLVQLRAAIAEIDALEDPSWPPHRLVEGWQARRQVRMHDDDPAKPAELLRLTRGQLAAVRAAGADVTPWISLLMDAELECGNARAAAELGERELARLGDVRDDWIRFTLQVNSVLALLTLEETRRARPLLQDAWPTALRLRAQTLCSDLPALLAALEGRPRAAARLAGYADNAYATRSIARFATDIAARERCLSLARAALGDATCDALMTQGRTLLDGQVAELAFSDADLG